VSPGQRLPAAFTLDLFHVGDEKKTTTGVRSTR
jgi:hypothetical protein